MDKKNDKDYLKRFKERHERLLNDRWASERVNLIGGLAGLRTKKDGTLDLNAPDVVDIDALHKFFELCRDSVHFTKKDIPTLIGYLPSLILLSKNMHNEGEESLQYRFYQTIAERIGDIPADRYITKHHAKAGGELENSVEALDLAKALIISFETIKDEDLKALILRDIVQSVHVLEIWKREAESGTEEEWNEDYNPEREQAELLEVSNRLGIDPAIMDRASALLKDYILTEKNINDIKEILQRADETNKDGDNEEQA